MTAFKLNLPTDIPWQRICVTEDMVDRVVCDNELPPKWHSSIAVFKYVPPDDFQLHAGRKITYLKVTATITGYQPLDEEIQGEIDWDGLSVGTRDAITELLTSYYPCNGAILQVVVGPHGANPTIPKADYPFFMDFEPKKRELYELATDTKEKQSRSLENINLSKSAGRTDSQEVMDIDMGGSTNVGLEVPKVGGVTFGSSSQGQWGTKQLNSNEGMESRTTDSSQEKRETYSFSTQISQMYNQLNSYHIGTNRAVFFVQPRPHVLEEPTGFVRGPRAVEGIQEFFLVVAQPTDQEDFCVSVRLDTGHLTHVPIMDYERRPAQLTDTALAVANLPTSADTVETRSVRCTVDYWLGSDDIYYKKHIKRVQDTVVYTAPDGFHIEGFSTAVENIVNGTSSVSAAPDGKSLTINVEARSSVWIQDEGDGWFADCPDKLDQKTGRAERRERVDLISDSPTKQVGEKDVLLITTRGLCCCDSAREPVGVRIIGVKHIPAYFGGELRYDRPTRVEKAFPADSGPGSSKEDDEGCGCGERLHAMSPLDKRLPIRKANEMIGFIGKEILKSTSDPRPENAPKSFLDTDIFAKLVQAHQSAIRAGKKTLSQSIGAKLPDAIGRRLAARFGKEVKEVTTHDLMTLPNHELARLGNMSAREAARFKLSHLGVSFRRGNPPRAGKR